MVEANPFATPQHADQAAQLEADLELARIGSGQRLVILGILFYVAAILLQLVVGPIAALLVLVTLILGIIGLVRMARGLGISVVMTILLIVLMVVPLIGLLVLVGLNGRATRALRAGGYKVGFLGASKSPVG